LYVFIWCTLTDRRYLVQQYDKEYSLWARDLKTQMEMTAWVLYLMTLSNI